MFYKLAEDIENGVQRIALGSQLKNEILSVKEAFRVLPVLNVSVRSKPFDNIYLAVE